MNARLSESDNFVSKYILGGNCLANHGFVRNHLTEYTLVTSNEMKIPSHGSAHDVFNLGKSYRSNRFKFNRIYFNKTQEFLIQKSLKY